MGVDNPIAIRAPGLAPDEFQVVVQGAGAAARRVGPGRFVVNVESPGECSVMVVVDGRNFVETFRAKRLPDPVASLAGRSDGAMGVGEFRAQGGVYARMDGVDFDVRATVDGFDLVRIPAGADPVKITNAGARFTRAARQLISQARSGDYFLFTNVRVSLPGDSSPRRIGPIVFVMR